MPVQTLVMEVLDGPDTGKVVKAESEIVSIGTAQSNTLTLTDPTVSGFHVELSRGKEGISIADLESTNGTHLGEVRIERGVVPPGITLYLGRTRVKLSDGEGAVVELHSGDSLCGLRGTSQVMRRLMAQVERLAQSNVPVLVNGESGTGKELVARALHDLSPRATGPFVTVDCGALAPSLMVSELFGHERGSFTGAERQHAGAFERADGGTVFLDEIGELPADLQPQLLGALERRRFRRVGGKQDIAVDVRVICATHRDLRSEVNAGTFRMDLYYRLAVVVLRVAPLRARVEDIPLLVEHFLRECGHDGPRAEVVGDTEMGRLKAYRWPGNVRELRNWVEATLAMGEAPDLGVIEHEPHSARPVNALLELPYKEARASILDDFEQQYLTNLMSAVGHNVTHGARRARMDRSYLIKLLAKHRLRRADQV